MLLYQLLRFFLPPILISFSLNMNLNTFSSFNHISPLFSIIFLNMMYMLLKFQQHFVHPHIALKFNFENNYLHITIIAIKQTKERVVSYIRHCGKSLAVLEEHTRIYAHTHMHSHRVFLLYWEARRKITK